MLPFGPLQLEYIDGRQWRLIKDLLYKGQWVDVRVPEGFVTDFASVPRAFWRILPPTGQYGKAAVVHDYLYRTPGPWTRKQADDTFKEAMERLGVSWLTRHTMWMAVRTFGGPAYKGNNNVEETSESNSTVSTRNHRGHRRSKQG